MFISNADHRLQTNEDSDERISQNNKTSSQLRRPSLKPRSNEQKNEINDKIYEIYLSKFSTSSDCDEIKQHICDNININCDVFDIVKLVRPNTKLSKLSFVSFKVSTSSSIQENGKHDLFSTTRAYYNVKF